MASVKMMKKGMMKMPPRKPGGQIKAGDNFVLVDNQDDTCTVLGVDAAGNQLDISGVATLDPAPTSSDETIITVSWLDGMTFAMHAVGPLGHSDITATATWADGSIGPFTFTLPVDVIADTAGGIVIVPGPPTVH